MKEHRWLGEEPKSHAFFVLFFYFYFLFFYSCALYYQQLGTKTVWSASYGKEKTPSPIILSTPVPAKKPLTQVHMV